jgi:C_GCAxxG_C_C family probable redox protein
MDKRELANSKFDGGYNCAQSVLSAFTKQLNIDDKIAFKLSSGFGAGMGRTQGSCGALTGAYMVLGLKYGKSYPDDVTNEKLAALIQDLTQKFKEEHGFTNCKDLLNVDLKTKKGQALFVKNNLHNIVCSHCVNSTINFLEEIIDNN